MWVTKSVYYLWKVTKKRRDLIEYRGQTHIIGRQDESVNIESLFE